MELSDAWDRVQHFVKHYGPLVLIGMLGLGVSVGIAWFIEEQGRRQKQSEAQLSFRREVETAGTVLQRTIDRHTDQLYALRDFYRSVPQVSRKRFATFVRRIVSANPALQAMAWEKRVSEAERPAYRRRMRAAGFSGFRITGVDGRPLPPDHRSTYFPVTYIEPVEGNEVAFGYDSSDRPSERRAIRAAIARDTLTASGRIRLVQETDDQFGVAGYLPVYGADERRGGAGDTTRASVEGLAVAVFRIPDLVHESMRLADRPFDLLLMDATAAEGQQFLGHYRRESGRVSLNATVRSRLATDFAERCPQRNICTYTLEIGQREWVLRAVPPVGYFNVTGPRGSTYVLLMGLLLTGGLVTFIFFRQRHLEEVERLADRVQKEKENADRLLLNILPEPVAEELKQDGEADPVHHGSATVLFADFVDFTRKAERLSADTLIDELHHLFSVFDRIVEHHGLEKIKTIGDAYMAAGGVPAHSDTHAEDCVRAGLDMVRYLQAFNRRRADERAQGAPASDDPPVQWALRVGISTGPLIAGVIGTAKFTYDVFGDTVVTASRMESSGVPGRVNISGVTREHIYGSFECEARGKIRAKGKGKIDMYLVEGGRDAAPSLEDVLGDERP